MSYLSFNNIRISGISACVPKNIVVNEQFGSGLFDEITLAKTIETIGVSERRISGKEICSSDLCIKAARNLLDELLIPNDSIDFIIFVSQTPDYRIPATAHIIQNKLCLKRAACFDINLGCSGYIYGLAVAFSLINNPTTKMVLLLAGDTPTKFVSPDDKSAILLFGDAGTATIIEKSNKETDSFFLLNSDGGGANSLMIHGGGYRNQSSFETLVAKIGTDGNQRNMEQLIMDGGEIFNFTIREVPKNINELLRAAKVNVEDIDSYTFHQANKFMLDFLIKKAKLNPEKIKFSINKFGNTSVASIPLTLIVNSQSIGNLSLLSGFGVGLSWGSALLKLGDTKLLPLFEL